MFFVSKDLKNISKLLYRKNIKKKNKQQKMKNVIEMIKKNDQCFTITLIIP